MKKLFLSHSSTDRSFAEGLARRLEHQSIPVWYSEWEIRIGDSIVEKIDGAIDEMAGLIVVLSEASVASRWVREELSAGLMRHLAVKNIGIFPVRIDNCQLPSLLAHRRYADFSQDPSSAFVQLVEAILPASVLIERIMELKLRFLHLVEHLRKLSEIDQKWGDLMAEVDSFLQQAVQARYRIEVRADLHGISDTPGFIGQFNYLVQKGYDLKSPEWEWIGHVVYSLAHGLHNELGYLRSLHFRNSKIRELGYKGEEKDVESALVRIVDIFDRLLAVPKELT